MGCHDVRVVGVEHVRFDRDHGAAADSPERQLYDWLDTAAGQDCIKKSGYVAVAPATAANSTV